MGKKLVLTFFQVVRIIFPHFFKCSLSLKQKQFFWNLIFWEIRDVNPLTLSKRQPHRMVKHIQTIRQLSVFDYFVGLTLKALMNDVTNWSGTL